MQPSTDWFIFFWVGVVEGGVKEITFSWFMKNMSQSFIFHPNNSNNKKKINAANIFLEKRAQIISNLLINIK